MANRIFDLTGIPPSGQPQPSGVVQFRSTADQQRVISLLLTGQAALEWSEIWNRANKLAEMAAAYDCDYAIVPDKAWIVSALEQALQLRGIQPMCKMGQTLVRLHTLDPQPVV